MAIQNLYTSRDNNANAETYVGQVGRLWFNLSDNTFYVSDGSTPGGIAIGGGGGDYGNANVANFLANYGSNVVVTTGNITAGNVLTDTVIGVDSVLVAANNGLIDIRATGNVVIKSDGANHEWTFDDAGVLTTPGDIDIGGRLTATTGQLNLEPADNPNAYIQLNDTGDSLFGAFGNLSLLTNGDSQEWVFGSDGTLTAPGNIIANNIGNIASLNLDGSASNVLYGNGVFAPAGASSYGNADVATFLADFGSNTIVTTGNITSGNVLTDAVEFDTAAAITNGVGKLYWNADEETLRFGTNAGTLIDIGQDFVYRVQAASNITKGQVVQFAGVTGDKISATPANAAAPGFNSLYVMGLASENIDAGNIGFVTAMGKIRDINTGSFGTGNILYLDPATPGGMVNVEPSAPSPKVVVAAVLKTSPGSGGIYETRVTAYPRIRDIQDVETTAADPNDFLVYSGSVWQHVPLDISLDTTPALGGNLDGAGYTISTTGNITGGNFVGSGAALTSITGANVTGVVGNATSAQNIRIQTLGSGGLDYPVIFSLSAGAANAVSLYIDSDPNHFKYNPTTNLFTVGNATVTTNLTVSFGTFTTSFGNINATNGNINAGSGVVATGNITGGNITTAGTAAVNTLQANVVTMGTATVVSGNAIPLTATVALLDADDTNSTWTLANGTEGQIMYFVANSTANTTTYGFQVTANIRNLDGSNAAVLTNNATWYPFRFFNAPSGNAPTVIHTVYAGGAWNISSGEL